MCPMNIRFYMDPESGEPHIHEHGIMEAEVFEVLYGTGEDLPARENSRMKLGTTSNGRYIQVIYVMDEDGEGVFVITAYELRGNAKKAFRRRMKRKPK